MLRSILSSITSAATSILLVWSTDATNPSTKSVGILDLPEELVVEIIALAATDDLSILMDVSLTCHDLHRIIMNDESVWRAIHLLKYDDPRRACAFPIPREHYDWRQRVIDRDHVARFLDTQELPHRVLYPPTSRSGMILAPRPSPPKAFVDMAPRMSRTALDLYLDLPAYPQRSSNLGVLHAMVTSTTFGFMAQCLGRRLTDGAHLCTVFNHMPEYRGSRRVLGAMRPFPAIPLVDETSLPNNVTFWHAIQADVEFLVGRLDHHQWRCDPWPLDIDRSLVEPLLDGIGPVRGTGLLGLKREPPDTEVWDWAGISGRWYAVRARCFAENSFRFIGHRPTSPSPMDPNVFEPLEEFDLRAVRDPTGICGVYADEFGCSDTELWSTIDPGLALDTDAPLPPVYFCGPARKPGQGSGARFLFGVVHLTRDSPPEVRWDGAVVGSSTQGVRFQAVWVGGPGARRGVFGSFKDCQRAKPKPAKRGGKRRKVEEEAVDWFHNTDGVVWLWKATGCDAKVDEPQGHE